MINKISTTMKHATDYEQTHEQIVARYNAKKAIYEAMTQGRKISLLDSQEFKVSQMHTTICFIRKDIENRGLPYNLCDEWIERNDRRMKRYWLEAKEEERV